MNLSLAQKQTLQALVEAGAQCSTVAYNPNTVVGSPEVTAVAAGWVQWYREATANLVEVIYTK